MQTGAPRTGGPENARSCTNSSSGSYTHDAADADYNFSEDTGPSDADCEEMQRQGIRGSFNKRMLTFKDLTLEDQLHREWDEQNVGPATTLFLACGGIYVLFFLLFRTAEQDLSKLYGNYGCNELDLGKKDPVKVHLQLANIVGIILAGLPIIMLRLRSYTRWVSCEIVTLVASILISGSIFMQNRYYMAKMFQIPGNFVLNFFNYQAGQLLALMGLNSAVQAMRMRSCRSWILPVTQSFMVLVVYCTTAPWPWTDTVLFVVMYSVAAYFPWRGSRKEERRARDDYLEKCRLRMKIRKEQSANRIERQKLIDIEDRLGAMDAWADHIITSKSGQTPDGEGRTTSKQSTLTVGEEALKVPGPPRYDDSAFDQSATRNRDGEAAAPNVLLWRHMSGRRADAARIHKMAKHITSTDYGLKEFFEDSLVAFPELGLFFVTSDSASTKEEKLAASGMGELEYQRTMCALFSVYWLLRLDGDGKRGFCFGVARTWQVRERPPVIRTDKGTKRSAVDHMKRQEFLETADWSTMQEIVDSSVGAGDSSLDIVRVEAILCLTAFHDILKMPWLCPRVAQAHAPYKGYSAGDLVQDHDIALAYLMEHYPQLIPSYNILPPEMQELVLFTQGKMQFNHGWFVQAEAPPGLMLQSLKCCLAAAKPGALPFYFFHWLTDVSGAEGTPQGGAEKLVLRFPEPVLAAFLWSIPYLEHLADKTETQVTEQYLAARWDSTFPTVIRPTGPESTALLRLTVMAQSEASAVVEAFYSLPLAAQEMLSRELALTGCHDQCFESVYNCGGPAFLVYYGPALLQRCSGTEEMALGLQILAAVFSAGRALWPLSMEEQGRTVLLHSGDLRNHDSAGIIGRAPATPGSIWVMKATNHREAALEWMPAADANELNRKGTHYWVLDLRFREDDVLGTENFQFAQI